MAELVLITGGARSGKSRFAEELLADEAQVTYIATAEVLDGEMAERIDRHRRRRPAAWQTLESPLQLAAAVQAAANQQILIDCLAVWISNLLLHHWDDATDAWAGDCDPERLTLDAVEELLQAVVARPGRVVAVTNEVGSGLVPPYRLGRVYRDLLGLANQRLAQAADSVYCCISGLPLPLKGGR